MRNSLLISAFLYGLLKPGVVAIIGALLVTASWAVYIGYAYNPTLLKNGERWIYKDTTDIFGYLSILAHKLQNSDNKQPLVMYGGPSSTGRALVSPDYLSNAVTQQIPDVEVISFWAGGLSLWELEAMAVGARGLDASKRDVTLLMSCSVMDAVAPHFLSTDDSERMLFADRRYWDKILDAEGFAVPTRHNNMALDNLKYLATRNPGFVYQFYQKPAQPPPWFSIGTPANWRAKNGKSYVPPKIAEGNRLRSLKLKSEFDSVGISLDKCKRAVERIVAAGIDVVMFEAPLNRSVLAGHIGKESAINILETFTTKLGEIASANGLPLIKASSIANFKASDFRDMTHIGIPEARVRYTDALAKGLVAHLKNETGS